MLSLPYVHFLPSNPYLSYSKSCRHTKACELHWGRMQTLERPGCNILSFHIKCCAQESWLQSSQINGSQLKKQYDLFTSHSWYFLFKFNTMATVISGQLLNIEFQSPAVSHWAWAARIESAVFQGSHSFRCPLITLLI